MRAGVGLKAEHYCRIIDTTADLGFFEVHAENYKGAGAAALLPKASRASLSSAIRGGLKRSFIAIGGEWPTKSMPVPFR